MLPFQLLLHQGVGEGATPFPGLLHFTHDTYLISPTSKQGDIKYHFKSLWYEATWDWTQVSRTLGESVYFSVPWYFDQTVQESVKSHKYAGIPVGFDGIYLLPEEWKHDAGSILLQYPKA